MASKREFRGIPNIPTKVAEVNIHDQDSYSKIGYAIKKIVVFVF